MGNGMLGSEYAGLRRSVGLGEESTAGGRAVEKQNAVSLSRPHGVVSSVCLRLRPPSAVVDPVGEDRDCTLPFLSPSHS